MRTSATIFMELEPLRRVPARVSLNQSGTVSSVPGRSGAPVFHGAYGRAPALISEAAISCLGNITYAQRWAVTATTQCSAGGAATERSLSHRVCRLLGLGPVMPATNRFDKSLYNGGVDVRVLASKENAAHIGRHDAGNIQGHIQAGGAAWRIGPMSN